MRKVICCFMMCLLFTGCSAIAEWNRHHSDSGESTEKNVSRTFLYMGDDSFCGLYDEKEVERYSIFKCRDSEIDKYDLKEGDIVEIRGDISVLWGVGTEWFIDKIRKLKVLNYDEVNESKTPIVQRLSNEILAPSYLFEDGGENWYYIINEDTNDYINIYGSWVEGEWGHNIVENGDFIGHYSTKKNIYLDDQVHICFVPDDMSEAEIIECIKKKDFSNIFYLGKSDTINIYAEVRDLSPILSNRCTTKFPISINDICSYEDFLAIYEGDILPQLSKQEVNMLKGEGNILVVEVVEKSQFYDKGNILLLAISGDLSHIAKNKVYNLMLSEDSYFKFVDPYRYPIFDIHKDDITYSYFTYK